jgi:hypothetical protein
MEGTGRQERAEEEVRVGSVSRDQERWKEKGT